MTCLKAGGCYSDDRFKLIVHKRIRCKEELFEHMNPQIIPMLRGLKDRGIKTGLITNCFSEEAEVIRKSILIPFFDAVCMSFEEGIKKLMQRYMQDAWKDSD